MTVCLVEAPVNEAERGFFWTEEHSAELNRMSELQVEFGREWGRLMAEVRAAAAIAALEEEYYRRAKLDRAEAFHWIISRMEGRSLHELILSDDTQYCTHHAPRDEADAQRGASRLPKQQRPHQSALQSSAISIRALPSTALGGGAKLGGPEEAPRPRRVQRRAS